MTKHLALVAILALAAAAGGFAPGPAMAQSEPQSKGPQEQGAPAAPQQEAPPDQSPGLTGISFSPPLRGAPGGRVGGASRGAIKPPSPLPTIDLLAPADQAGQTISAAPTLYYFVSRPVPWPMQLTISAPQLPAPIIEVTIPSARSPGTYPLRLADYRTRLDPGIVYTWSVSIILDPKAWSRNIVASAAILRVPPSPATESAASAAGLRRVAMFASNGLWYDAISAAFDDRGPNRHAALDQLLQQVGLTDAAHFERTAAGSVGQ
jgi:hypothetical protein